MRSLLRKPSRGEWIYFVILLVLFAGLNMGALFEPYNWIQRQTTALINSKDYEGDGVIVAIDDETLASLDDGRWTRSDLAALLIEIGRGNPSQIAVDRQYFSIETGEDGAALPRALEASPVKVIWSVDISPEDIQRLPSVGPAPPEGPPAQSYSELEPSLEGLVTPAANILRPIAMGSSLQALYVVPTSNGLIPSIAQLFGGEQRPATNIFPVDLSQVAATVPRVSANEILEGRFDPTELADRQVLVSFTTTLGRDTIPTPHETYASRAAGTLLAAETLRAGPPTDLGWIPGVAFAFLGILAWMLLRAPYGRIVALAVFLVVIVSPLALESRLIFQSTSGGVFALVFFGIGRVWKKGRDAVQTYRGAAESKARFLAQASHDLRQPIHAIGLLSDRLSQTDLSPAQAEIVSKISWSVDNASRMFRSLLDIAAIESGTLQTDIGPVSINELLAEIDSQNGLVAEQAGVDLRFVPSELVVKTDRALIGTMLQNLVSNAIKYSPGKAVVVGCRRRAGRISLYVVDNGRGIPASELKHVKKEFYRSSNKSSLGSENKGLGLSIVNRLAGLLDLKFTLRSKEGRGTAASIDGLEVLATVADEKEARPGRALPLAGLSVAIADDEPELLQSTRELLEQWGCQVRTFEDFPLDLTGSDILLSDFDFGHGNTLADHGANLESIAKAGTRVIVISGHHPDQIRSAMRGFEGLILSKPLRAAELRSALMAAKVA